MSGNFQTNIMLKNNGLTQPKLVISHSMNIILPTAHPTVQIICHVSICQCMHLPEQTACINPKQIGLVTQRAILRDAQKQHARKCLVQTPL